MSERNIQIEDWPEINSLILINSGTRISYDEDSTISIVDYEDEVVGVVLSHDPGIDWRFDAIEVLVSDHIYRILKVAPHSTLMDPYFNVRQIDDDGTTKQF
jgi:hypothetical protein